MADRFEMAEADPSDAPARVGRWRRAGGTALAIAVVGASGLWLSRERIADQIILDQLERHGVVARYEVENIGPRFQVLRNVVVGDPARPDLVVERVEVRIDYVFGTPRIGAVKLVRPRLYGTLLDGKPSFGALDPLLFPKQVSQEPFTLPDLAVSVIDGRALMLTGFGKAGIAVDGEGNLQSGFAGTIAASAPKLSMGRCRAADVTLFGRIAVDDARPRLEGPLRMASLQCDGADDKAGSASGKGMTANLKVQADKDLAGLTGTVSLRGRELALPGASAASLALDARLALRDGALSGRVEANAGSFVTDAAQFGLVGLEGALRYEPGESRAEFRGAIKGEGARVGSGFAGALARSADASRGTMLGPLLDQFRKALAAQERGSRLVGEVGLRRNGEALSIVVPQARLTGGSGQDLFSLSRFQLVTASPAGPPLLAGNFATAGAGLPRIVGRLEQGRAGQALFRLTMAPWREGANSLAIPELMVAQVTDGSIGFSGLAKVSGAIPGGTVQNLEVPLAGSLDAKGQLALWKRCIQPRFERIALGTAVFDRAAINLCPSEGYAIVKSGRDGLRIAARADGLALTGRVGESPLALSTGAISLGYPGTLRAAAVDVRLGTDAAASRIRVAKIDLRAEKDPAGTFDGLEARLADVPLDLAGASGHWRYADGRLSISQAGFDLTDRLDPARFEPLRSDGAMLTLEGSRISAKAALREAKTSRGVGEVSIGHDLATRAGHADLTVPDLKFDKGFQPAQLTRLALGVVANVEGRITGSGRIDWNARGVASTGSFGTENLDLAAAFGPAKGIKGRIEFLDLLGMVSKPHQRITVASINPGIEVTEGQIDLTLMPEQVLRLHDARWPFLGGTLVLEPTDLRLGVAEARRYTLTVTAIDAAKFIEKMELGNLAATGTFDGQFPLVFDANGGRIEEGTLVSRSGGGNVSYIGALTYENMGAMANFAFDSLKSLDYRTMAIAMRGDLEGEIVTNVKFDGVRQGAGTKRNFITKQVANLPIQFNVNIRAPFYQLITSFKALYDPAFVKDPRLLGLVDAQGRPLQRLGAIGQTGGATRVVLPVSQHGIQPAESGNVP